MRSNRPWHLAAASLLAIPLAAQWEPLPQVPLAPGPLQAFAFGDRAVVFGGPCMHDTEHYRVAVLGPDRAWRTLPAPPLSLREELLVREVGGRLVAWGGRERKTDKLCIDGAVLDPVAGTWREMPAAPIPGRSGAAVAVDGSCLAVVGGGVDHLRRDGDTWRSHNEQLADGAVFDVAANRWRRLPDLPLAARRWSQLVFAGKRLVVLGGCRITDGRVQACNDAAVLGPDAAAWQVLPPPPIAWTQDAVTSAGGDLVLAFARSYGWKANAATLDLAAMAWQALPGRDDFGISPGIAHAYGGCLFVYSGRMSIGPYAHDAWSLLPSRDGGWQPVALPPQLAPRERPGVARDAARIAIVGGGRVTGVTLADGPHVAQPDVGKTYGDGIVVDVTTGSVHFVPPGPGAAMLEPAVVFFGDGLLVVGGHDVKERYTAEAATYRLR